MNESVIGMLLAAGKGTRMLPFTEVTPKPLIPFLNTPLLAYPMQLLQRAGVKRVVVNAHHLGAQVQAVAPAIAAALGMECTVVHEDVLKDSGGGIVGMWEAIGAPDATAVVLNTDTVMDIDLAALLTHHRSVGASTTLVVHQKRADQPGRIFVKDGRVVKVRDVGSDDGVEHEFCGIHVLEPAAIARLSTRRDQAGRCCVIKDGYHHDLLSGEPIATFLFDGFWGAIDNPKLLLTTQESVLSEGFEGSPFAPTHGAGLMLLSDAIHGSVRFQAPVFVGAHVSIAEGATIGPNAVIEGCQVEAGTRIANATLYGMGSIAGEYVSCVGIGGRIKQVAQGQ